MKEAVVREAIDECDSMLDEMEKELEKLNSSSGSSLESLDYKQTNEKQNSSAGNSISLERLDYKETNDVTCDMFVFVFIISKRNPHTYNLCCLSHLIIVMTS